jgi:hypothetical protein
MYVCKTRHSEQSAPSANTLAKGVLRMSSTANGMGAHDLGLQSVVILDEQ